MREAQERATRFLRTCVSDAHWTAILVKSRHRRGVLQRCGSIAWACGDGVQRWIWEQSKKGADVYVSVNGITVGAHSRARVHVSRVRHVFLDVDGDAWDAVSRLEGRSDVPPPSCVVHTSPLRAHLLWRVSGFDGSAVERLQRLLAAELGGDLAATSVTQLTRLPGFRNYKYDKSYLVWVEYRDADRVYAPHDFPLVERAELARSKPPVVPRVIRRARGHLERAVAYLARVPPAIAGQHGDLHTFQTCCRVVRGFALDDDLAFAVLAEWNARCQPPWTERDLLQKIRSARRNGREPIGGLL